MSKIGKANLDLQEQAEELGFESVQEALDNGYKAYMGRDGNNKLVKKKDLEFLMEAHEYYEHHRRVIIDKLTMLMNDTPYKVYKKTLKEAIDFLNEREV